MLLAQMNSSFSGKNDTTCPNGPHPDKLNESEAFDPNILMVPIFQLLLLAQLVEINFFMMLSSSWLWQGLDEDGYVKYQ